MKLFKIFFLALGFTATTTFAQDVPPVEELPVATINESYLVTVPEIPIEEYYFIDISHLSFADEAAVIRMGEYYLTGNVVEPILNYEENYIILHVLVEHLDGDTDYTNLQHYLTNFR